MSLEQCHWNKHTTLSMSAYRTNMSYNNKHVIGTKHIGTTYNTKHVIGTNIIQQLSMSLEQAYNTKHVIGTNIQH